MKYTCENNSAQIINAILCKNERFENQMAWCEQQIFIDTNLCAAFNLLFFHVQKYFLFFSCND